MSHDYDYMDPDDRKFRLPDYSTLNFDEFIRATEGGAYCLKREGEYIFVPVSLCDGEPDESTGELMVEEWWLVDKGYV